MPVLTEQRYAKLRAETMALAERVDDASTSDGEYASARMRLKQLGAIFEDHWSSVHAARDAARCNTP